MEKRKFKDAPDDIGTGLFFRQVSDDNLEIGCYRVAYGFRVRVGRIGGQPGIDYCAGADHTFLEVLYSLTLAALKLGVNMDEFPWQKTKPFYNDPANFKELIRLAGDDFERVYIMHQKSYL